MNHYKVTDKNKNIVRSNLTEECELCFRNCTLKSVSVQCPIYFEKRRNGITKNNSSETFLCCNKTKTSKLFKAKLEALSYTFPDLKMTYEDFKGEIKEKEQKRVNRLVHNLTTTNAKIIQEAYDLIPQETLSSKFHDQINEIGALIHQNPSDAALMFLHVVKHSLHMKSEFSIYRKLDRLNPTLEKRKHKIHKILMNVLHAFFIDFSDKDVYVDIGETETTINVDYESVQVAFYHLIENASKYVKPKSKMLISFLESEYNISVHFKMNSLYVEKNEVEKIFNEGYSGIEAKKTLKDGEGIGMWRVKQMLDLNDSQIKINWGQDFEDFRSFRFAMNSFELIFPK